MRGAARRRAGHASKELVQLLTQDADSRPVPPSINPQNDAQPAKPVDRSGRAWRLRSQASLIVAIVLLQAVVIGLGWFASLHVARVDLSSRSRERTIDDITHGVEQFNQSLSDVVTGPLKYGTDEWAAAQSLVEACAMPRGAAVVLLDHSGHILCHPSLRNSPNLRNMDYSEVMVTLLPTGERVAMGGIKPGSVLSGETDSLHGTAAVAITYNNKAKVRVVAHRSAQDILAAEERNTSGLMLWGGLAGVLVLGLSVVGSVLLVRRYDSLLVRANERLEAEVLERTQRGLAIRNGLIFGLAKLADYRDTDTGKHLERICRYCDLLASELVGQHPEVDRAWIDRLCLASSMHDIGKVGIPDSILLKPGILTPEERQLMQMHAVIGADTLIAIRKRVGDDDLLNMGIQVALSHHERFDGTGYPFRLSGEQIPLSARIVALADMYDALTSVRVYKKAMGHAEAVAIILEGHGSHFDPAITTALKRIASRFEDARSAFAAEAGNDDRPLLFEAVESARRAQREAA